MEIIKGNTTKIELDTGLDLTQYSLYEIGFRDPDGNKGLWEATDEGGGVLSVTKNFDIEGNWVVWSAVDSSVGQSIIVKVYDVPEEDEQITTLDFVKSYLGITSDEYDFKILSLIPVIERDYETIQNIPFTITKNENSFYYGKLYPLGSDVTATEMIAFKLFGRKPEDGYKNITSERLGSYSVSYSTESGYPKSITSSIKKFVRMVP